jgi:hypothetical protein
MEHALDHRQFIAVFKVRHDPSKEEGAISSLECLAVVQDSGEITNLMPTGPLAPASSAAAAILQE